jgi:glycosyltransferase involved in cell wall biosynthesis
MRIAIFTNAYKPIISGVVNTIELMSKAYAEKGHEVFIFAPGYYDYVDDTQNVFRYKWVNLTYNLKFPIAIPFSYKASKMLRSFNPDIIHTHHPFVLGKSAHYYSDLLEKPLVFTFHTQYEMYTHYIPLPTNLVKSYCRSSVKNFAAKCDVITTPAQSISDLLKEEYGVKDNINVIPNAIDLNAYKNVNADDLNELKSELKLGDSKVILYAGRIAPEKNLIFLMKSFKKLISGNLNAKLLIVGGGTQLQELKDFASENDLSGKVILQVW